MVDIIEQFLDVGNVAQVARQYLAGVSGDAKRRAEYNSDRMRALMSEFIHGPYGGGLFDIWSGTDPQLYVGQMNAEFLRYMRLRDDYALQVTRDQPREALTMAQGMDPFARVARVEKRAHAGESKHVPGRTDVTQDRRPRGLTRHAARCTLMGPVGEMPVFDAASCQWTSRSRHSRRQATSSRADDAPQDPYVAMRADLAGIVHLAARDDEQGDTGCATIGREWTARATHAPGPYDFADVRVDDRLSDPVAGSGEVQYHLIELDSRLAILNRERSLPIGYGSAQEQLAEEARVASRYSWWKPDEGVIPEAHYKRLTRGITPSGRVTMADERENARDIFGRDSRGFILSGRR